jgi:hypothetical protein
MRIIGKVHHNQINLNILYTVYKIEFPTFLRCGCRGYSWKGEKRISGVWQLYIATENTQRMLTFVHRCRKSLRFLKERKKCLFKHKLSNRNIFIYTYPIHQFFVFSFAGSTSWYVSHHSPDGHRVGGLVALVYFETPLRTHYRCIRVRRLFVRASWCGGSDYPLKNMKYNIRE